MAWIGCTNKICLLKLRLLAYRSEDIYKRLEPQELFTRKELEQTLKIEVNVALSLIPAPRALFITK